jgi:glycosyltransferase involved in cell wall biosynthesis
MNEPSNDAMACISHIAVIVPARNEEARIGAALRAIRHAADLLEATRPSVTVRIITVLDSCHDGTAKVAARTAGGDPRFILLPLLAGGVGASRAHGIDSAMSWAPSTAHGTWLANTDADSVVPAHWLRRQMEFADAGADAVLGTVEPDPNDLDPAVLQRWKTRHPFGENHPHVYGANLGVRASAYLRAGGFPHVRSREDRILIARLRTIGATLAATDTLRVRTSGRTKGRAPQGFAAYLRSLGQPAFLAHGDGLSTIAEPPPRLTGSAAAIMRPLGLNSIAVAAPISAADVKASPDGVN